MKERLQLTIYVSVCVYLQKSTIPKVFIIYSFYPSGLILDVTSYFVDIKGEKIQLFLEESMEEREKVSIILFLCLPPFHRHDYGVAREREWTNCLEAFVKMLTQENNFSPHSQIVR
jgi:hypothetical protein